MASLDSHESFAEEEILSEKESFGDLIKERLCWSREKWKDEGELNSQLHKFVNSLRFWGKKVEKAQTKCSLVLTLFEMEGGLEQHLCYIIDAIINLDQDINIVGFSSFRNTKYMALYFENEKQRDFVETNLKKINGKDVAFTSWVYGSFVRNIRVLWLPWHVEIEKIKKELEKYFTIIEEEREWKTLISGKSFPSGTVNFKGVVKKEIKVEKIPHVTEVCGFECLWTVQGRQIVCLTCDRVGHKSAHCPTPYCAECRELKPREHECNGEQRTNSYANAVIKGRSAKDNIKNTVKDNSLYKKGSVESHRKYNSSKKLAHTEEVHLKRADTEECKSRMYEETSLRKDWGEQSSGEESAEEESNTVLEKFSDYLKELESLKAPVIEQREPLSLLSKVQINKNEAEVGDAVVSMEIEEKALKRKLENAVVPWEEEQFKSTLRKTYGRRCGGKSTSQNTVKSVNLFEVLKDDAKNF